MVIHIYLFARGRRFDHFHQHILLKTFNSVLTSPFPEFLFSHDLENILLIFSI